MPNAKQAANDLRSLAKELFDEIESVPSGCIYWSPVPGVWSVMDNLCHIAEFVPYWAGQIVQVIRHPEHKWGRTHHDQNRLAAVSNTTTQSLETIRRQIWEAVDQAAATLADLTEADLAIEAASRNPRWALKPTSFIADTLLVTHMQSHLAQIRRNVSQYQQLPH